MHLCQCLFFSDQRAVAVQQLWAGLHGWTESEDNSQLLLSNRRVIGIRIGFTNLSIHMSCLKSQVGILSTISGVICRDCWLMLDCLHLALCVLVWEIACFPEHLKELEDCLIRITQYMTQNISNVKSMTMLVPHMVLLSVIWSSIALIAHAHVMPWWWVPCLLYVFIITSQTVRGSSVESYTSMENARWTTFLLLSETSL